MSAHEACPTCGRCHLCGHGPEMPVWTYPWWLSHPQMPPQLTKTVSYHVPRSYLKCSEAK